MIKKPYLIAEIGKEHKGDMKRAMQMIVSSEKAGFDAVKFQAYDKDELISDHPNYQRYLNCYLSVEQIKHLKDYTNRMTKLDFHCSVFNKKLIYPLSQFTNLIKIPSTMFDMPEFVKICIETFPNIHLSTGMHDLDTIKRLVARYRSFASINKKNIQIYHCVSQYPTRYQDLRLSTIEEFKLEGFSYHGNLIIPILIALALDVHLIELHYSLDDKPKEWQWNEEMIVRLKSHMKNTISALDSTTLSSDEVDSLRYYQNEFKEFQCIK